MPRKAAPRDATPDIDMDAPSTSMKDSLPHPNLDEVMDQYDWDADSTYVELFRDAPDFFGNKRVGGIQATFPHRISVEDIREKFGGGRYSVRIKRDNRTLGSVKGIRIPGEPLFAHGTSAPQFADDPPFGDNGGAVGRDPLTSMLLQTQLRRERTLEQKLERTDELLRERSAQSSQSPDAVAFEAVRQANREALESQRAWMQQLQHARDSSEGRMSELFQAFLAAQGNQRGGHSLDADMYRATVEALKEENRLAREEHANQLRVVQEQARDQVASTDRHATMTVESLRAQFETQVQILQTANAGRVQSLETQVATLTGELQQARTEGNQLRDKISELRSAVSEAKFEASKGGDGLTQLTKLGETAEAIKRVAGTLGLKTGSDSAVPDFKERLLEMAQSGLPERVIGSLASAFRGPAGRAKVQAEGLRQPTQADHAAWAQWRQQTAVPQTQPQEEEKPKPEPPRGPSVISLMPEDETTDPEDQEQLLRYLARRLEESAGITKGSDLATELWAKVCAAQMEEHVKELSAGQIIAAMEEMKLGLSFAARRQLRDVMSAIHSMPSSPPSEEDNQVL